MVCLFQWFCFNLQPLRLFHMKVHDEFYEMKKKTGVEKQYSLSLSVLYSVIQADILFILSHSVLIFSVKKAPLSPQCSWLHLHHRACWIQKWKRNFLPTTKSENIYRHNKLKIKASERLEISLCRKLILVNWKPLDRDDSNVKSYIAEKTWIVKMVTMSVQSLEGNGRMEA